MGQSLRGIEKDSRRYLLIALDFMGLLSSLLKWSMPGFLLDISEPVPESPFSAFELSFAVSSPSSCTNFTNSFPSHKKQERDSQIIYRNLQKVW